MKITRILLLLLLSINLHAQTDSLELENLKRQESSTINQLQSFRQQKSNELQQKNEEISSYKNRLTSQQSTQRELTAEYNQLVEELDNYHANEVKLNLYHQFINQHFFKASEMSKDVQNFYELIIEENQLPINAKFMLLDNAVIYTYSVDNEGYVSNYKILNSSDRLKKKFEKLKEKERLVVIAETAIEIYRLTGIDVHYFELKQNVGALDIKVKAIANDIYSTNSSITMTKLDLMNLENTWNHKINLKEEELVAIQNSVESLTKTCKYEIFSVGETYFVDEDYDLLKKVKIQNKVQANDTILYCYDSGSFDGLLIKTECKYKIKCKDEYNDNEWKEIEIKSNEFQEIPIQIGEIQIEFDDRTIVHLYLRSQGCM